MFDCDHDVVPYGNGDYGRCTKCGDGTFPIRAEWHPFLIDKLRNEVLRWLERPGSRRAHDEVDLLLDAIRRTVWDFDQEGASDT